MDEVVDAEHAGKGRAGLRPDAEAARVAAFFLGGEIEFRLHRGE
jgi:hypothetical protein